MSWESRLWDWTGFKGKALWDWLKLLVVPLTLAFVTIVFSLYQDTRQNDIEERRAAVQATVEANRVNANALQAYYDKMSELLLERNLRSSEVGSEARSIARANTLATLRSLDGERKGSLLRFLYESKLIGDRFGDRNQRGTIVWLAGADLTGADLFDAALIRADLYRVDLSRADLREADLGAANLSDADLRQADLSESFLFEAILRGANLSGADLRGAVLENANLREADLGGARYNTETKWPDGFDPEAAGAVKVDY